MPRARKGVVLAALALLMALAAGYQAPATAAPTVRPTATPRPTSTPTPTATPLPQQLKVTTTLDLPTCPDGPGNPGYSLRCALTQVDDGNPGRTITFGIPSTDPGCAPTIVQGRQATVCKISPANRLPALNASGVVVDGFSQPGASSNSTPSGGDNAILTIQLDGSHVSGNGLTVTGVQNDAIQGLSITNFHTGVGLSANTVANVSISGNFIGLAPDGSAAPNQHGLSVTESANVSIGGSAPSARNVVSGNAFVGVSVGVGQGNVVAGNLIGAKPDAQSAAANGTGIDIGGGANVTVGGTGAGDRNVISGNSGDGIAIHNGGQILITGNSIGVDGTGSGNLGNGASGISVTQFAQSLTIERNTIAFNGGPGVRVDQGGLATVLTAQIHQNQMFSNQGLGIDVFPFRRPSCIAGTSLPGSAAPCPVIRSATAQKVSGTACSGCLVELYIAADEPYLGGLAEGKTYLGSATADDRGKWTIDLQPGQFKPSRQKVTATATTTGQSPTTSEFAFNMPVVLGFQLLQVRVVQRRVRVSGSTRLKKSQIGIQVRWSIPDQSGIAGFNLFAGKNRLTTRPIGAAPSHVYSYTVRWTGKGPYYLGVLLLNGVTIKLRPSVGKPIVTR